MKPDEASPLDLIIVGAGGAGHEALWVAQRQNEAASKQIWNVLGFVDDNPALAGVSVEGIPVLGTSRAVMQEYRGRGALVHFAVGNNQQRKHVAEIWAGEGYRGATLVDPTAVIAKNAIVGEGTYVGPLSIVAPQATVGRFVLINTHVGVGHHAVVADFAQLCPGVRVNGECRVDRGAFLGSNSVVHPGLTIGEGATIGANSFVIRSVKPRFSMVGVPARIVSRPAENGPDAQA